jgi:hypothetical protein
MMKERQIHTLDLIGEKNRDLGKKASSDRTGDEGKAGTLYSSESFVNFESTCASYRHEP